MQTGRSCAVIFFMASVACGGGQGASAGALAQSGAPATASATPGETDAGGQGAGSTGPGTTTLILGDAGELQGAKLTETHTVAAASSSSGGPLKGAHGHEPGRGLSDIRAIIIAHRDAARACYDKALADHPGIEGDLVVQWTIDPKGNVSEASLDTSRSQISEPAAASCIVDIIKKIQFASSPGGFESKASYPFNFHPHHGQAPAAQ